MEEWQEKNGAQKGGTGVEPENGETWAQNGGGLAPDFDFKFGGIKATGTVRVTSIGLYNEYTNLRRQQSKLLCL